MNKYPSNFYEEILKYYRYASRNTTINGDAIFRKMESPESSKKCWVNQQGDENYIQ